MRVIVLDGISKYKQVGWKCNTKPSPFNFHWMKTCFVILTFRIVFIFSPKLVKHCSFDLKAIWKDEIRFFYIPHRVIYD